MSATAPYMDICEQLSRELADARKQLREASNLLRTIVEDIGENDYYELTLLIEDPWRQETAWEAFKHVRAWIEGRRATL